MGDFYDLGTADGSDTIIEPRPVQGVPPSPSAAPGRLRTAGWMFADVMMFVGIMITGGLFGMLGFRKAGVLRIALEIAVVGTVAAAAYWAVCLYFQHDPAVLPLMLDLSDPMARAPLWMFGAAALAYAGGLVVHRGWNSKGDQKAAMLVLAVGMTLVGLRIAFVCLAFGEVMAAKARVETAHAGLAALEEAAEAVKAKGGDSRPVAGVIVKFMSEVYGSKFVETFMQVKTPSVDEAAIGENPTASPSSDPEAR